MRKSKEWGEFFPITISQAAYNETLAQDYYPLTKEQAIAKGYTWRDEDPKERKPATAELPDDINAVPDTIINEVLVCKDCGKNYRVTAQELALSKQMKLPISDKCFECRFKEMRNMRNPRQLWERACMKCKKEVQTTYAPERPEIIYCESCYAASVD